MLFKDIPLALMDYVAGKDPLALDKAKRHFVEQTPLQFVPPPIGADMKDWLINVTPTIAEGAMEVGLNWDSFSQAPVDPYEGLPTAKVPMRQDRQLERFGAIESWVSNATGGAFSPPQVNHLITSWLPGLGSVGYGMVNKAATQVEHAINEDSNIGVMYNPPAGYILKFSTQKPFGPSSQPVNDFYKLYERSAQAKASYDQAIQSGAYEKARKIWADNPELEYHNLFSNTYGEIMQLKIDRGRYLKVPGIDPAEKKLVVETTFDRYLTMYADDAITVYSMMRKKNPSTQMK